EQSDYLVGEIDRVVGRGVQSRRARDAPSLLQVVLQNWQSKRHVLKNLDHCRTVVHRVLRVGRDSYIRTGEIRSYVFMRHMARQSDIRVQGLLGNRGSQLGKHGASSDEHEVC